MERILVLGADPGHGAVVYEEHCQGCHRASGLGQEDPDEPGIGASLLEVAEHPEAVEEFVEIILLGERLMPAFETELTDQDVADVVAYVQEGLFAP